jgi:hypothetical protein
MEFHKFKELMYFQFKITHVYLTTIGHVPFPDKQMICSSDLGISMLRKRKELETFHFANRKHRTLSGT